VEHENNGISKLSHPQHSVCTYCFDPFVHVGTYCCDLFVHVQCRVRSLPVSVGLPARLSLRHRRGSESEGGSTVNAVVSRAMGEVLANHETLEASECILDGGVSGPHLG